MMHHWPHMTTGKTGRHVKARHVTIFINNSFAFVRSYAANQIMWQLSLTAWCLMYVIKEKKTQQSWYPWWILHDILWRYNKPPRDKTNKVSVRLAKTQISLGIRPVWSESSLCAQWVAKDPSFLHADSEDADQTERITGRTTTLLVLSWDGSNQASSPNKVWELTETEVALVMRKPVFGCFTR